MAQLIDPIPPDRSQVVCCCYVNATSKIQIARITNVPNWYFERVVFPGQRLMFESVLDGQLEIHTGMMASAILSDTIPCSRLQVSTEAEEPLVPQLTPTMQQQIELANEGIDPAAVPSQPPELEMLAPDPIKVGSL